MRATAAPLPVGAATARVRDASSPSNTRDTNAKNGEEYYRNGDNQMKHQYWTVQVRPTPTCATAFAVGVIVSDYALGRVACRFLAPTHPLWTYVPDAAKERIADLEENIQTYGRSMRAMERLGLLPMSDDWNNQVTLAYNNAMSAPTLTAATELLYRKLISINPAA